ncbi:tripartite motif-containing protein 65 [Melozone crissalis]|uniref:tripartite motif-containing protein 65 n=1 Tax=Melozone crissalis TaxID=40204 RepID=UPI0023DBC197|nr:tripartite motif-containing protein 65 [Melozone crissalis]
MASAMSQKLEEKLVCSICLELFKVPVTLPCGHNFCRDCISDHWAKKRQEPEPSITCPECRRPFEPCPKLEKNVTLHGVVELARDGEQRGCAGNRSQAAPAELCPRHGRPLELFCLDERRCICCICTERDCRPHRRVLFEEERARKQTFLKESLEKAQEEAERIEQTMKELEVQTESIKDCSELKDGIQSKFTHLRKALEDLQRQTVARIEQEQSAALERVGKNWDLCRERLDVLGQHRERAESLLACPEHRTFLQEFPLLPPLESPEVLVPVEFDVAAVIKPISEILTSISRLLLEDLPGCVTPRAPSPAGPEPEHAQELAVKAVAPLPKCQLRAELLKDHRNLTFDSETANRYLEVSKGAHRAKHRAGRVPGQGQGPRFQPWQVLCTQSCGPGRHYWEVKISSHSVILGVTYRGLPHEQQQGHRFNIGLDGGSWGLQVREDCYLAWHEGRAQKIQEQLYKNLGVSLDYGKGLLSFYGLGERTKLIHSFHSVFTEPLYPVFWLCEGRVVTLCQRD